MAKFFYGNDLYNDLYLNNNREMSIKMLLLDQTEPEINEFYIYNSDVSSQVASKIYVPYGSYTFTELSSNLCPTSFVGQTTSPSSIYNFILNGNALSTTTIQTSNYSTHGVFLLEADVTVYPDDTAVDRRFGFDCVYSDTSGDSFNNFEVFPDGVKRTIRVIGSSNSSKTLSRLNLRISDYGSYAGGKRNIKVENIKSYRISYGEYSYFNIFNGDTISTNAIDVDVTRGTTFSIGSTFIYGATIYAQLNVSNFYASSISTILNNNVSHMFGVLNSAGKKYTCNNFNKMIISNKEIQGNIVSGSLKVDGNSPIRRTLEVSCIIDRVFGTSAELRLRDFDDKKIKVMIGISDSAIGESDYDYSTYFLNNGMQKDLDGIVWFKLGVFIPKNISIRHSTDSYSISLTSQDKFSSLDGSFGGVLGEGIEFRDPTSGENTSFYDTVIDSFSRYTKEPSEKINVSFTDNFELFKEANPGQYVTAGSSQLLVKSSQDIFVGMGIQAPGVYSTAKVAGISSMGSYDIIIMDDIAYDTVNTSLQIFRNSTLINHGATFSYASNKNFFAIEPLTPIGSTFSFFAKPTTINFKNSNETYEVYTTISDWSPTTWGFAKSNFIKAQFTGFISSDNINITGQTDTDFYITDVNLQAGDILYPTVSGSGFGIQYINEDEYYQVLAVNSQGYATLKNIYTNAFIFPDTNVSGVLVPTIRFLKGDFSNPIRTDYFVYQTVLKTSMVYNKNFPNYYYRVVKFLNTSTGQYTTSIVSNGLSSFNVNSSTDRDVIFQVCKNGQYAAIANNNTKQLIIYSTNSQGIPSSSVYTLNYTDYILAIVADSDNNIFVSTESGRIIKYLVANNGALTEIGTMYNAHRVFRLLEIDSEGNLYAYSDVNNTRNLIKYDSNLVSRDDITLSNAWYSENLGLALDAQTAPSIESITLDTFDNIYLITSGSYLRVDGQIGNIQKNFIVLNGSLDVIYKAEFFDSNINFNSTKIVTGNKFAYIRYKSDTRSVIVYALSMNFPVTVQKINALKELAPQTDSTIVKSSSDKVSNVLDDVKSQLGILQYYYDFDGNFMLKEDKRLTFHDPNFRNLSPYSFDYNDYNVNVKDLPFEFDFGLNKKLVGDYSNAVDLSTFKNDFFIYGIKKGLDVSSESGNIPMLYHIMIDDIELKNIPTTYKHPWQQYFIDQGIAGTTYSNFLYFRELKENFEFKDTRDYVASPSNHYVQGEYILVNAATAGTSSSATYLIYEVMSGGTPSTGSFPSLKDGTIEFLNNDILVNTGLSVRFYSSLRGANARTFQGIYKKMIDESYNGLSAIKRGSYFIIKSNLNSLSYIYKVKNIYSVSPTGTETLLGDDIPISINFYSNKLQLNTISPQIGESLTRNVFWDATVDLGAYTICKLDLEIVEEYKDSGYKGIFRSNNTGSIYSDFVYQKGSGDPSSWAYYYDIVNIIGNYEIDTNTFPAKTVGVGIDNWAANKKYYVGDLVYSDGNIYQALTQGESGWTSDYAPTGFGDSQNLIRDLSKGKLIWRLNQTSIDFEKMKVSAIGSRKNSINDKDINILFSQKDALAYFETSGYYFVVINDLLGYSTYSEGFHNRLENLIKQYKILYPGIKLVFVPQSLIGSSFIINKLTALKDAFSVLKRNFYLNFVNGQGVNLSSVPIYSLEPLGIIRVVDRDSEICGNFVLTDYVIPLSNEGFMSIGGVKTNPYDDKITVIPETITGLKKFDGTSSFYGGTSIYV